MVPYSPHLTENVKAHIIVDLTKGSGAVACFMRCLFEAPKPVTIQVRAINEDNCKGHNVPSATQGGLPGAYNEQINDGAVIIIDDIRIFKLSRRVGALEA